VWCVDLPSLAKVVAAFCSHPFSGCSDIWKDLLLRYCLSTNCSRTFLADERFPRGHPGLIRGALEYPDSEWLVFCCESWKFGASMLKPQLGERNREVASGGCH